MFDTRRLIPLARATQFALLLVLVQTARAGAETPSGMTGQSWSDPKLGEVLRTADLVAEVRIRVGGQFSAYADVVRSFKGTAKSTILIEGFNSYEWNTAYYTIRSGESYILALYRVGNVYCLATPSSGRFPLDRDRVVGRFTKDGFLVEIPGDDFREALSAFYIAEAAQGARSLQRLVLTGSVETKYLAIVMLGELAATEPTAVATVVEALSPLAKDDNSSLREAAAKSLGRIESPSAAKALAAFIGDDDASVARIAALAVCDTKSPGACRELVAWLERTAAHDRRLKRQPSNAAIRAQSQVYKFLADGEWVEGVDEAERADVIRGMVETVASAEPAHARVAARVLGHMGASEAVEDLARLLDAEDSDLREEAASALTAITLSPAAYVREKFTEWWRKHGGKSRREWIALGLDVARSSLAEGSYDGDSLAKALLAIVRDPISPWIVREKASQGTGWRGMPIEEIGGPLVAALAEARLCSQSAGARITGANTISGIMRLYPESGAVFLQTLASISYDSDSEVRKSALDALGDIDPVQLPPDMLRLIARRLMEELAIGTDTASREAAAVVLRALVGRYYGFYLSKGYELDEEQRGLERWLEWWAETADRAIVPYRRPRRAVERRTDDSPALSRLSSDETDLWIGATRELVSGAEKTRAAILTAAKSPSPRLRAIGAALMGLRAERGFAAPLTEMLSDDEPFVKLQAAWALGNCLAGAGDAPPELVALGAVKEKPPKDEDERKDEDGGGPSPFAGDGQFPPSIVDFGFSQTITRALGAIQAQALMALGKIGGPDALEVLRIAAESEDDDVATAATYSLSLSRTAEADALLLKVAAETELTVTREVAARGLVARRPIGAAAVLIRAAAALDRWNAYPLVNALGRIVREEDARDVALFLNPDNEAAAVTATYAMSREPGAAAASGLLDCIERGGSSVKYYAIKAIGTLAKRGKLPIELRERTSALLAASLSDYDVTVASGAATALEYAGDAAVASHIMKHLRDYEPPNIRAYGAAARFGGTEGLAFIHQQLATESWSARYFALRALRHIPTRNSLAALMKYWRDPESPYHEIVALSLIATGPGAVRAIEAVLAEPKGIESARAAMLLARMPSPAASAALQKALKSDDRELKEIAAFALEWRPTLIGGRSRDALVEILRER